MSLAVINGANIVARNVLKKIAPLYKSIKLCDYKPYRPSVYKLCQELEGKIEKVTITNTISLEHALEGADKALYFTHDYFYLAPEKISMIQATAGNFSHLTISLELTKKLGVKKVVCVCPIEFNHYSELNPFESRIYAVTKAMELNPGLTLLRPNIIFGEESYSIRFLIQSLLTGRVIYPRLRECGKQKYYPMYSLT